MAPRKPLRPGVTSLSLDCRSLEPARRTVRSGPHTPLSSRILPAGGCRYAGTTKRGAGHTRRFP